MDLLMVCVALAALFCGLVAGFLFAYAVVVMPGIKLLDNKQFLRAFQVTDGVIQNNQPLFVLVWLGSVVLVLGVLVLGWSELSGLDAWLANLAVALYVLGVQLPTFALHLPLNGIVQRLDLDRMGEADLVAARVAFEPRWNRSNEIRTGISCLVALLLISLACRL